MPGGTSAERGREVRQRLLGAAAELIPEVGWHAVSTRVLAERAEVAPGLVHYHFRSLQHLLIEAAVGRMRELVTGAAPALQRCESAEQCPELLLGTLDDCSGTDPTSLLFVETYLAATRDEDLHAEIAVVLDEFRGHLAQALRHHGVDDPAETASVLAAAVDGMMLHRALRPTNREAVGPVLRRLLTPAGESGTPDSEGSTR